MKSYMNSPLSDFAKHDQDTLQMAAIESRLFGGSGTKQVLEIFGCMDEILAIRNKCLSNRVATTVKSEMNDDVITIPLEEIYRLCLRIKYEKLY